jgi:hypothetical protein
VNSALSGIRRRCTAKIHRTVRCAPDCPVSQRSAGPTVGRGICARHVVGPTIGRGHRTVRCAPDCPVRQRLPDLQRSAAPFKERNRALDSVRCAPDCPVRQRLPDLQRSAAPFKERNRALDSVRCAPDCSVRPKTEGKISLPELLSTAPSCLGAIKGTPRRMKEYIKHSYNIPKHQDIDSTHLVHCDSI